MGLVCVYLLYIFFGFLLGVRYRWKLYWGVGRRGLVIFRDSGLFYICLFVF